MRLAWYTKIFFWAFFSSLAFGDQTVAKLRTNGVLLIVPVSINESGPYSFILDTGSNRTLVRNDLLAMLGISSKTLVPINLPNRGVIYGRETVAKSVAVGSLGVNDLEIEGIDSSQITRMGASIQGLLGEDFLKHFDVLIDNHAKTLTLDDASDLVDSLRGDHLPLAFSGRYGKYPTVDRLVLDVSLPFIKPLHFLLDTATDSAVFFPSKGVRYVSGVTFREMATLSGNSPSWAGLVTLEIGKRTFHNVMLVSCEGVTRDDSDVDGMLPTRIFDRLFISHSKAYAIANPHIRKP